MSPPVFRTCVIIISTFTVCFSTSANHDHECIPAPNDLRVFVKGSTATLYWTLNSDLTSSSSISGFEVTYELVNSPFGTFRVTHGIAKHTRTFQLRGLFPLQRYKVYMVTITDNANSNRSETIEFSTNLTDTLEYIQIRSRGIQLEEALIVLVVVGLWVFAMVLFIKQWDNIRIIQPQEHRYKHSPKNLHTVQIVKKPQDSVIYKNYSRKMSLTMVEREKKLLRMNTVPIMENLHRPSTFKTLPTIEMSEEELSHHDHSNERQASSNV